MAATYPAWDSIEAFAPVRAVAQRGLEAEGLYLSLTDDSQLWIKILHPEEFTIQERMAAHLGVPIPESNA